MTRPRRAPDLALPADELLLERILARQRAEILEQVARVERRRGTLRAGLALAASVLAAVGLFALTRDAAPLPAVDPAALPPLAVTAGDPLAVFGDWSDEAPIELPAILAAVDLPDPVATIDDASWSGAAEDFDEPPETGDRWGT
ncbi:MAG: hypothetical protein Kow0062_10350 [Acidobacteriota bacterium]